MTVHAANPVESVIPVQVCAPSVKTTGSFATGPALVVSTPER